MDYIVFEITHVKSMANTKVLAIVTGTAFEDSFFKLGLVLILIILIPILLCIGCIISIICCCCNCGKNLLLPLFIIKILLPNLCFQVISHKQSLDHVPSYP